jgi:hypothetical protein
MNVHLLPTRTSQPEARTAADEANDALNELLRQAVVAYHAQGLRAVGSISSRHHLAISHTYLHAVEIMLAKPGVKNELACCLDVGIFDIRRLARVARDFTDGPAAA